MFAFLAYVIENSGHLVINPAWMAKISTNSDKSAGFAAKPPENRKNHHNIGLYFLGALESLGHNRYLQTDTSASLGT
jgi:hypothetical protein